MEKIMNNSVNNNMNVCFFAMAKGVESVEGAKISRYIGVAPVTVLAVNPSKAKIEEVAGYTPENEPEYISKTVINDKEVEQVRIDFFVKTVAERCNGIDMTTKVTFFLRKAYRFNKDQTKVQVIDKYGRTAWVTKEQCKNHEIPMYSNGPANLDKDYRPCFNGEEDLTNFLKNYLGIPDVMKYVNNAWVLVDDPQNSECRLDEIEKYFSGNFEELREAIKMQPNNKVKCLFGVRTTDDNKQYQTVYTQMFLRNNSSNYSRLDKDVNDRKANGAYATTEFAICDLKEYVVAPTDFSNAGTPAADDPFSAPSEMPW